MNQKRVLFLGGSYLQIPPIKYSKEEGYYVITCDYLPDNPGHKYADEYHNVSTTDIDGVLKIAEKLNIDGIVAYASDPAAPTAAFVGNKLGLPSNPYKSVYILTHKDKYRDYLRQKGFFTPNSMGFTNYHDAMKELEKFSFPILCKPVDSAGSKGVTILTKIDELKNAISDALKFSRSGRIILEDYVEKDGYQIAGDGFIVNGKLVFRCFANEHFDYDCNGIVPIGESFPYIGSHKIQQQVHNETQKLITELGMKMGAINFDVRIDLSGNIQLMEIGPRNGGNLIPEVTKYITGVDMVKYTVDSALGLDCTDLKMEETNGFYASFIIHSLMSGKFIDIQYSDEIKDCIIEEVVWVSNGEKVEKFLGSNNTLGTQILKFKSMEQMLYCMDDMNKHIKVSVN